MIRARLRRPEHAALGLAALLCLTLVTVPGLAAAALRVHDAPLATQPADRAALTVPPPPPAYRIEDLGWIEVAYHPSTRDRIRPVIARAGAIRDELSALLGRQALVAPVKIRVAAFPAELDSIVPAGLGESAATTAVFGALRLAVVSAASRHGAHAPDLEGAFRHALAHLALDEATAGAELPRWFHEGFALHAAGAHIALRSQALSLAALRAHLVPLDDLEASLPAPAEETTSVALAQAADVVRFLADVERRPRFADALSRVRAGAPLEAALAAAYGAELAELERAWRADVARRYGFVPVLAGSLLALGLLVAGGLAVQRIRARRPPVAAPRRGPRAAPERRSRPLRAPAVQLVASRGVRSRGDGDVGVPKVEHDGEWHTLH